MKEMKTNFASDILEQKLKASFLFASGLMETFAASALLEKDKEQSSTSRFVKAVGKSQKRWSFLQSTEQSCLQKLWWEDPCHKLGLPPLLEVKWLHLVLSSDPVPTLFSDPVPIPLLFIFINL